MGFNIKIFREQQEQAQAELKEDSTNWGNYKNNPWNITNTNSKYSVYDTSSCPYKWTNGNAYGKIKNCIMQMILLSTGASDTFSKHRNI